MVREVMIYSEKKETAKGVLHPGIYVVHEIKEALEELERGNYKMVLLCTEENTQCARIFGEMLRGVPGYGLIPVVVVAEDNHLEEWARRDTHCYEYLVRPLTEEDYIRIVFPLVSSRWEEKNQQFILIKGQKGNSYVPVEEVIYILKQNRTGYVVTKEKTYEIPYMVLQEYAKFYAENFVQCHRSTIVNRHKIEQVNFTYGFVVAEGVEIAMGRKYYSHVRSLFDSAGFPSYNERKPTRKGEII